MSNGGVQNKLMERKTGGEMEKEKSRGKKKQRENDLVEWILDIEYLIRYYLTCRYWIVSTDDDKYIN